MSLFEDLFVGPLTYKVGYGDYWKSASDWRYVDVPELAAHQDTAQAVRRNAGAQSARMFAYDAQGRCVYWYFSVSLVDGGSVSRAVETAPEARVCLTEWLNNRDVLTIRVKRMTGPGQIHAQGTWKRAEANAAWVTSCPLLEV